MSNFIFPSFFLPPIAYFHYLKIADQPVQIETHEHYVKQTYRNRAVIGSSNGPLKLIIPVQHSGKTKTPMKDLKISYAEDWQRTHWNSIVSVYKRSPYFEFYEDELHAVFHQKEDFLIDYNTHLLDLLIGFLKINISFDFSEKYQEHKINIGKDINPKTEFSKKEVLQPYYHIFEDKNGFIPNLSIIDLLFHQGPYSVDYF